MLPRTLNKLDVHVLTVSVLHWALFLQAMAAVAMVAVVVATVAVAVAMVVAVVVVMVAAAMAAATKRHAPSYHRRAADGESLCQGTATHSFIDRREAVLRGSVHAARSAMWEDMRRCSGGRRYAHTEPCGTGF